MCFKEMSLDTEQTVVQIPAFQLISCVTLGKQSNLSEPQVSFCTEYGSWLHSHHDYVQGTFPYFSLPAYHLRSHCSILPG